MMCTKERQFAPLMHVSLEELVPHEHFYRHLECTLDLSFVRAFVQDTYAGNGRPSIDPPCSLKMLVLPLDMVDNLISLCKSLSRSYFHQYAVQAGYLLLKEGPFRRLLHAFSSTFPRDAPAPAFCLRGPQAETDGKGQESTSRAVHRRLVLPAAMAGVRCR
jgi:hypothetical protein